MKEEEWQQGLIDLGQLEGWLLYHTRDSRKSMPGFPDLTLINAERGIIAFIECKMHGKYPSVGQREWLTALAVACPYVFVVVFPEDYDAAIAFLQGNLDALDHCRVGAKESS